jgi:hypothetical protein
MEGSTAKQQLDTATTETASNILTESTKQEQSGTNEVSAVTEQTTYIVGSAIVSTKSPSLTFVDELLTPLIVMVPVSVRSLVVFSVNVLSDTVKLVFTCPVNCSPVSFTPIDSMAGPILLSVGSNWFQNQQWAQQKI